MPLTGSQKRFLRGLAHHKDAIVQVGHQGATEAVQRAFHLALEDHELVKVRFAQAVDDRDEAATTLAEYAGAELVQQLGRTAVFYRRRKKNPLIELPKAGSRGKVSTETKPAQKKSAQKKPARKKPAGDGKKA